MIRFLLMDDSPERPGYECCKPWGYFSDPDIPDETFLKSQMNKNLSSYLGRKISSQNIHLEMIRLALMSVAETAVLPMQDLVGLGASARMNHPAGGNGHWRWRLRPELLTDRLANIPAAMATVYGRS